MRFFLWIGTEQPWPEIAETAKQAESTGWDGIYLADHFMPNTEPAGLGPRLEAWTALSAIAALTERVRLGVLVTGNTYRHPAVLANMAATTDRISGGRLVLGLGAGWQISEHDAYGIELHEPRERIARLDEACEVIRLLTTEPRSNFDGRYYRLSDAPCEPKPIQSPLPLLIGSSGEQLGMRLAARRAHIWNCWGTPETIAAKLQVLERHLEAVGRDPATIERSTQALVRMSSDQTKLARWREETGMPAIVGGPSEIRDQLARYQALGIDEFVVSDRTLGREISERHETMAGFLGQAASGLRD